MKKNTSLKVRTQVRAGALIDNHNQTLRVRRV